MTTFPENLHRALAALMLWHERARQRALLEEMDDHQLRDIGITRAEALGEAGRPFWTGEARTRSAAPSEICSAVHPTRASLRWRSSPG
jgi:uncharacterized protein YjiS (DUF1127 family)